MTKSTYRERLLALSNQLIKIQKPIQILDSIKWPREIRTEFFDHKFRRLPAVDAAFYQKQKPNYDVSAVFEALNELRLTIARELGKTDPLGLILQDTTTQYMRVISLLRTRGTPDFLMHSQSLYGSAKDHLCGDNKSLLELGESLCGIFSLPGAKHLNRSYPKVFSADDAVQRLSYRLSNHFGDGALSVVLDDGIVSDASAGGDKIKINKNASFSELDLQVLEVHEGWVHVGTTLNGRNQPWATWLSVGSPRITATQEGLAVLIETLTFSSFPNRAKRVSDRVIAIDMAEQGADFLEVFHYFCDSGISPSDSYTIAQRVFRGGMVEGGACFTKDLSYVRGFIELVNFIRTATLEGVPEILPMLFVGKVTLDDIPVIYEHYLDGLISPPEHLPPMFRDLNGLYVWFGFSSGIAQININNVQEHFSEMFRHIARLPPAPSPDCELS
ncbi:flavohemoglobin expression-modulating QEGLA motif protein [Methylicorpusculum oleiharenae]|uniref:flavohemoglobin expression-modulating QEGLA motif protein n=1 Tax=Methylicorpusculum oleiharenae TaxID=1338687 RepID=UPI00135C2B37|nr:flavohemoglobin expression-modulating QEGLA motif protein [Methylicorpusculum oleiharenae]MCD2450926.1 flavohemoglobin expression-modulating QEGLA motif protein [Methylicorpusculum oleiharenae]